MTIETQTIKCNWASGLAHFAACWTRASSDPGAPFGLDELATFARAWEFVAPKMRLLRLSDKRPDPAKFAVAGPALAAAVRSARNRGDGFNPWAAARLGRDEIRNAAVLAALLQPEQAGHRAIAFLDAFLRRLDGRGTSLPVFAGLPGGYRVRREDSPLGVASERVDLTIEGSGFVIGVEVKIDAPEGPEQFARYLRTIHRRAADTARTPYVIVLAKRRIAHPGIVAATWKDIAAAARRTAAEEPANPVSRMLDSFAKHVADF